MTEEEKLVIVKTCSYEKLMKKLFKQCTWSKFLGCYQLLLMKKALIQKLEKARFCLTKYFTIVELVTETKC